MFGLSAVVFIFQRSEPIYHKAMLSVSEAGSCSRKPGLASHGGPVDEGGWSFHSKGQSTGARQWSHDLLRLVRC